MSVRFPYFGVSEGGAVLHLEPDATDADVTRTIATLIEVHLNGFTPQQMDEFWRHSMMPLVSGLMVATVGDAKAIELFAAMPKWTRDAVQFEDAAPGGAPH